MLSVYIMYLVHAPLKECLAVTDTPRYRGMVSELDCWMEWIENQMAEEMYDSPSMDDLEDFIGGRYFFLNTEMKKS